MRNKYNLAAILFLGLAISAQHQLAFGQGYGTDTQNVLTPAGGGMAGVSIARPQDVAGAIFGNPATLAQFPGTQFSMGGAWVEAYPTATHDGFLDARPPYSVTSRTQGFAGSEIGVIQDLRSRGLPGGLGVGLAGLSGIGDEYRGLAPDGSILNNLSNEYMVLGINLAAGFELTDRLSAGAALTLGTGFEQLGFIGPISSTAMVHDYALRGTFGIDYDLNPCNTIGVYYQTRLDFQFPNAVRFTNPLDNTTTYQDMNVSQPQTIGLGIANSRLMGGNLLIAADIYYKLWEDAPLFEDVFINQWAFAVGAQLTRNQMKYRLGYSYNTNPTNHNVGNSLDGFPVAQAQIQLFQAAAVPAINQHRLTAGVGRQGFLLPNIDLDLFAGGMFDAHDEFGAHSQASIGLYYIGMGMTWKYDNHACCRSECDCRDGQSSCVR
jgi:long-chain fatty acid transport protein